MNCMNRWDVGWNNIWKIIISISDDSDGIIVLEEDANKWGLELRLYLHHSPACIHATKNRAYRNDYEYRINDVDVIWELFEMGYRIGKN